MATNLYPEHAKLLAVSEQSQVIGEFLEWAESEGWKLAALDHAGTEWVPDGRGINRILALYFGIVPSVLESEKRTMLAVLRVL